VAFISKGPVVLTPGGWRTLETFYGKANSTVAYFRLPSGVRIKVRYGYGSWFGFDRQKQTLDGESQKTLSVSGWVGYARMQAYTDHQVQLSWELAIAGP
jgi:hypothetical protein